MECRCETLPKTNIAPENSKIPKRKLVFQPSIFRCENVSFREGNLFKMKDSSQLFFVARETIVFWKKPGCHIRVDGNVTGGGMINDVVLDKTLFLRMAIISPAALHWFTVNREGQQGFWFTKTNR